MDNEVPIDNSDKQTKRQRNKAASYLLALGLFVGLIANGTEYLVLLNGPQVVNECTTPDEHMDLFGLYSTKTYVNDNGMALAQPDINHAMTSCWLRHELKDFPSPVTATAMFFLSVALEGGVLFIVLLLLSWTRWGSAMLERIKRQGWHL